MNLHAFDLIISLLLVSSCLLGFSRGLYSELPSLIILITGLLIAHQMHSTIALALGGYLPSFLAYPKLLQGLGWLIPLSLALLLSKLLAMLGSFAPTQSWWKRWLAAISGLFKGSLLSLGIYALLARLNTVHSWMMNSWSASQLDSISLWVQQWL